MTMPVDNMDNILVEKLRASLTTNNADMFLKSFCMYLRCGDDNAFVVDLEDVWRWMGFSRKDPAKRLLEKNFIKDQDFETVSVLSHQSVELPNRPIDQVCMTVDTFKELCMLADTQPSRQIRKYYITMERITMQHIKQCLDDQKAISTNALALMEEQKALVQAKDAELRKLHQPYIEVLQLEHVYINKASSEMHRNAHKLGMAVDEKRREAQLNTAHANGTKNVFVHKTSDCKLVESIAANSIKWYNIGGIGGTEHYSCNLEHTATMIKVAAVVVDTLVSCRETMSCNGIVELVTQRLVDIMLDQDDAAQDAEMESQTSVVYTPFLKHNVTTFMNMTEVQRDCRITFTEGTSTRIDDLEDAFFNAMFKVPTELTRYKFDDAEKKIIQSYGCTLSERREHTCRSCHKLARAGCCSAYAQSNRIQKFVFHNMQLQPLSEHT